MRGAGGARDRAGGCTLALDAARVNAVCGAKYAL